MLRMAHRILSADRILPLYTSGSQQDLEASRENIAEVRKAFMATVSSGVCIMSDSAEQLAMNEKNSHKTLDEAVPTSFPPFTTMVFEWMHGHRQNALVMCAIDSKRNAEEKALVSEIVSCMPQSAGLSDARWACRTFIFESTHGFVGMMPAMFETFVRNDGSIAEHFAIRGKKKFSQYAQEKIYVAAGYYHAVAFTAISLMNCRNIEHVDRTDEIGPSAKWLRRMKQPRIKHYTLEVKQDSKQMAASGELPANKANRSFHICQGHIKRYTEDAPLFGPGGYVGNVFCPSHVRGDKKFGEVIKDYKVTVK